MHSLYRKKSLTKREKTAYDEKKNNTRISKRK